MTSIKRQGVVAWFDAHGGGALQRFSAGGNAPKNPLSPKFHRLKQLRLSPGECKWWATGSAILGSLLGRLRDAVLNVIPRLGIFLLVKSGPRLVLHVVLCLK